MAGNSERIDDVVAPAALKQVHDLTLATNLLEKQFIDTAKAASKLNALTGNSKSFKDYNQNATAAALQTAKLQRAQNDLARSAILLNEAQNRITASTAKTIEASKKAEQQSIKQADADTKKANTIIKNAEKERLAEIKLEQQREKNIDDFNKKLAQQEEAARKLASPYNQLSAALDTQRKAAKDLAIIYGENSKQFKDAAKSVIELDTRLKGIDSTLGQSQRNVGNYKDMLGGLKDNLIGIVAGGISFAGVTEFLSSVFAANVEIEDSLSDLKRTAGLTAKEAENLSEQLKKIDTRTSLKGLIDIAIIGGQLGIAKDQLVGFTRSIDQLAVVLSGEITGGAEAVATALGKINGAFKVQEKEGTDVETSFNKTGSAILALGQAGLATGEFLQDFALRVVGVANKAKIGLPTILAYSAVLEESGTTAEVAGSSFNKLVGNLASKRQQFFMIAKIADSTLTLKEFTKLINTDAQEALQKFFAGLNAGGKDLTSFTDLIDQIGLKGGPAKNAVIALAQNQALLNERIKESTDAYSKGTLAGEQFAIKNNNLAGSVDKLGNMFTKIVTSGKIAKFFQDIVDGARYGLEELNKLVNSRSFDELVARTFTFGAGAKFDKANTAFDFMLQSQKSKSDLAEKAPINNIGDVTGLDKKKTTDLKQLLNGYQKAYADAYHAYSIYYDGIKSGDLTETNEAGLRLSDYKKNAQDILYLTKQVNEAYKKAVANEPIDNSPAPKSPFTKKVKKGRDTRRGILNDQLETPKNDLEAVLNDENAGYEARLKAIEAFEVTSYEIINKGEADKVLTQKESENLISKIHNEALKDKNKVSKDFYTEQSKIINDALNRDIQTQKDILKNSLDVVSKYQSQLKDDAQHSVDDQLLILAGQYSKGLISAKEYQDKKRQIEEGGKVNNDEAVIQGLEFEFAVRKSLNNDTNDIEEKLAEAKRKRDKDTADNAIAQAQREHDDKKKLQDAIVKDVYAAQDLLKTIVDAGFQNQLNAIQAEKDAIDNRTKTEIDAESRSLDSSQEKADKIAIINAKAAAQQAQLDQKAREVKRKQAQADRLFSIAKIIEETAVAVVEALPNLPLAFAVGALGAIQLATVLATPIPAYEKGTNNAKGGLSLVGEVGKEYVIQPDGDAYFTPSSPTLMDIPKGSKVISNMELMSIMANPFKQRANISGNDNKKMIEAINNGTNKTVRALRNNKPKAPIILVDTLRTNRFNDYRNNHFR